MKKRFRLKPIEVDAIEFVDNASALEIYEWMKKYQKPGDRDGISFESHLEDKKIHTIVLHTNEGPQKAVHGDWVIKGPNGFFRSKPTNMDRIYEEVTE